MPPVTAPDIAGPRGQIETGPRGHIEKRLSIIDAAACVFCREGFGGTNIDMIAVQANVSRQTVYNHHGDKEKLFQAVVREVTERINADIFDTLATFPDRPTNLEADLTAFAVRLTHNCICNRDGKFLRKLIQSEGERYPELFADWRVNGPAKVWSALAARFARLALSGHLDLDDPDLAARQFLALVNADLQTAMLLGDEMDDDFLVASAKNAVRTFLRAYGKRA
jgi:AcrR family transcriptional regulator